jgi:hypothetical protein
MIEFDETTEAIILVKASPQFGKQHGETVCCAGLSVQGEWLRLYPVTFRTLDQASQFSRWDRIRFRCRRPQNDPRPESRRVDHQSIEIIGQLRQSERQNFLGRVEVTSLNAVRAKSQSLALLRPKNPQFSIERKEAAEIEEERARNKAFAAQPDMFNSAAAIIPYEPCPYRFIFRYETDDGARVGTCQDWETDATFFRWGKHYGEDKALAEMQRVFGDEYPQKGMAFAMGTHSLFPETWLINGVIRLDEIIQGAFDF